MEHSCCFKSCNFVLQEIWCLPVRNAAARSVPVADTSVESCAVLWVCLSMNVCSGQKKSLSTKWTLTVYQDKEHKCSMICGYKLNCGLHRCQELCHRGNCQPCWQTSTFFSIMSSNICPCIDSLNAYCFLWWSKNQMRETPPTKIEL